MPRPRSATTSDTRSSLSREQWVAAAVDLLVDGGIDQVRVDVLAKRLGVTRGSFYWHFKDRGELLEQVLQAWHQGATEHVSERFSSRHADPQELVREIISLPRPLRAASGTHRAGDPRLGTARPAGAASGR